MIIGWEISGRNICILDYAPMRKVLTKQFCLQNKPQGIFDILTTATT